MVNFSVRLYNYWVDCSALFPSVCLDLSKKKKALSIFLPIISSCLDLIPKKVIKKGMFANYSEHWIFQESRNFRHSD